MANKNFWEITANQLLNAEIVGFTNIPKHLYGSLKKWIKENYPSIKLKIKPVEGVHYLWCADRCTTDKVNAFMNEIQSLAIDS